MHMELAEMLEGDRPGAMLSLLDPSSSLRHHGGRVKVKSDRAAPEQWRLRSPCVVEDLANCFVVRARGGQQLAYVYYEDDPRRRSIVKVLSRDQARRIAAAIAKLPEVVRNLPMSGKIDQG